MSTAAPDWLGVLKRDYLRDFIRAGGSSVKFAICEDEHGRRATRDQLEQLATEGDYQFAFVDATTTRMHTLDRVFHEIARQIDWDERADAFLRRLLTDNGLTVPNGPGGVELTRVAEANRLPERALLMDTHRWLWEDLFRDYAMSQEFRLAMLRLCYALLMPDDQPALTDAVREWLRGELRSISSLKPAQIFQKVTRNNARYLIASLAHWLRRTGQPGLVLVLDITRYAAQVARADRDAGFYYGASATLDLYEVLRQLVDATGSLEGCLVVVLAEPEFLTDPRRGVEKYWALYLRIVDDVRAREVENPLGSLIRLTAGTAA